MDYGMAKRPVTLTKTMRFSRVTALALTTCVGLLAGMSSADDIQSKGAQSLSLKDSPVANTISVRANDTDAFLSAMASIITEFPGTEIQRVNDPAGQVFTIKTSGIASATAIQDFLKTEASVQSMRLNRSLPNYLLATSQQARILAQRNLAQQSRIRATAPRQGSGILALPDYDAPQGGSGDPQFSNQWHLLNGAGGPSALDNNVTEAIHDVLGYTGEGIVIGVPMPGTNIHIDTDHNDLVNNYSLALSQQFDPDLLPDNLLTTGWAGIAAAERGNSIGGRGVAPGATLSSFNWTTATPLIEFEAYEWLNQQVDIKFYYNALEYAASMGVYNDGHLSDYVMDPLENSIRFGRNARGVVNIFSPGTSVRYAPLAPNIFLPDPYNFPPTGSSFSPVDELANGNIISNGVDNGFVDDSGNFVSPMYVTGNTNHYTPALDRRSIIISPVASDGHYDIYAAQGTSVFASVYAGTNNLDVIGDPGDFPLGVGTTTPDDNFGNVPSNALTAQFGAITTAPAVASGIVALMLDANPKLTVRDIQHIFFESIQESTKDASVKWPNFDTSRSYYIPDVAGLSRSFWQTNTGLYTGGPVTNQAIRHSDNYGFGVIDTELAVTKAINWGGTLPLHVLDTGLRGDVNLNGTPVTEDFRVPITIPTAEWVEFAAADGSTGAEGLTGMLIGETVGFNFCVRQNFSIESVVVELTIAGEGSNDLFIMLISPSGSRSILAMPSTLNVLGTSDPLNFADDELDLAYSSGFINGDEFAFYQQPFLTWKHWGEKSGGVWSLVIRDYGPDEATPEGAEPGDDPLTEPGANMITELGEIGIPGSEFRSEKELRAFRIKIYATDTGIPIFDGCDPNATNCPADLNGDGRIDTADLHIYIAWYMENNALADLDYDGDIDYRDLIIYRGLWRPGYCDGTGDPFVGGRPRPGAGDLGSDDNPIVHPI